MFLITTPDCCRGLEFEYDINFNQNAIHSFRIRMKFNG